MWSLLTLSARQVDAMAATRKVVELPIGERELAGLQSIARSRTESASHVVRARILLHYRDDPSCYAVGRAVGVTHQTVQRCLARAGSFGVMAALDDSPRPGKEPEITVPARAWLVSLACQKAKAAGYPHELWTTRLLARHSREHGPPAGHASLARIAQGTVCKLLAEQAVKPHKVRYYLERRDPEFDTKMSEVLSVYQEVAILRAAEASAAEVVPEAEAAAVEQTAPNVAFISYDEKPGIQAISNTAPDLPPVAGQHACVARDHEYKRHGTLSLPLRRRGGR
jgi:transposase